ncbi:MAG: fatty acid desaturase [Hyphomicrobiaceae bacterium]|nr:fatty acid desaturase [Hyphomicrobiaceae bacterium]
MSHTDVTALPASVEQQPAARSLWYLPYEIFTASLSTYFLIVCWSLYWIAAGAGALLSWVLPRSLIERAPLLWLSASSIALAGITQAFAYFLPDYSNPREIAYEIVFWLTIGVFARSYLIYTDYPATFEGLKQSIDERPLERWFAKHLHHPIDAIFTRIWVANSVALIPLTVLLILPWTINYYVITGYALALLLSQFPSELIDHTHVHTRVFQPRLGASERIKSLMKVLQFYYDYVLTLLVARVPHYYRVQHLYIHHVEGNGPADSQTTEPYDRASFTDFSRHAFIQGVHLVFGWPVYRYLAGRGKKRPMRMLVQGLAIWWTILIALAWFNPIAAVIVFITRFIGGNVQSLVAFWQHGLVDPEESHEAHGSTVDFFGPEHGNLGNDYHVEHHIQPGRHWSAYYDVFSKQSAIDGAHNAVVFQKEMFGPLAMVAALWRRDYQAVARYAHLRGVDPNDKAELARIVEERTRPIGAPERTGFFLWLDTAYSRLMSHFMPTRFYV